MQASSKKLIARFLSPFLFTLSVLLTGLGFVPSAEAADTIPAAARLIGAGGNVYSQNQGNSNTPSSCLGGTRGITSDGTYVYFRTNNSSSVMCKTTLAGVFVSANTVTNLSSYSSEQRALTYANGCILFRDSYVASSGIMCVDTTSWTLYGPFTPTGTAIPLGGFWLSSNIMNFPDGRIGAVSAPGSGGGSGANACPSNTYCKILRLYTVSRIGNSLTIAWSEDVTLSDPDPGWPSDDHGMATDGTYLYQIKHESGYKVWKLNSGTPSTIIFNGDGGTTPCGATTGTSNTLCPIYSPINGSTRLMSNATFFGRSHLTNQYIMGDYGSSVAQFWISDSVAPPAGIGSDVTAPVLSAQSASSLTQTTATLNFTSGEAGTYYYLIYGSASSAPDTSTIISQGASPPTIVKGTSSATASAHTVSVTGLTNGTSYKAYVVVKDSSGNTSLISTISFATFPALSLQPTNDTTTAGLTDSFTVKTTSLISPQTRAIKWQVATDTVTAVASVSWADVASGTGFTTETFTTSTLTTAMNKYRYRAIVTYSDTSSTYVETSTVATLTVNPAITFTSDTSTVTRKYGASGTTRTVIYTGGTDTKTVSASSLSLASGKITFDTSTALFTVDTRTAVGTYLDTITITDAKGATASYVQTITFTVADTLTVTSDTPTALTYTGSAANFTPTVSSVSGLISGDVISGATYNYSASALTCASGGTCSVGEIGPGGGYVFYVSPTVINVAAGISTGGIYLEAAPVSAQGTAEFGCTGSNAPGTSYAIGSGAANTLAIMNACATAGIASRVIANATYSGLSDWFMPSLDEMTLIYNNLYNKTPSLGGFTGLNYGSSSEGTNGNGYQAYWWFGTPNTGSGQTNKNLPVGYRPIRAFSPVSATTSTVNYGPSTTKPTNAATYTITPSALTFSSGAASNYVAITYRTSTLTINKATQAALSVVPLYQPFKSNPTTATLLTTGGSDTGTVTYAYVSSLSTASGCTLSGSDSSTVSVTSDGTCRIVATKAATSNYLVAVSDTGTVTFHLYISGLPIARSQITPTDIPLVGANPITYGNVPAIITSGTPTTQAVGSTITLTGSGFTGTTSVKIKGLLASFVVNSDTSLTFTVPVGLAGKSGRIVVENAAGTSISDTLFLFT